MSDYRFRLEIDCNNSAFDDESLFHEVARILHETARQVERGNVSGLYQNLRDSNGNPCGTFRLKDEGDAQ